MDNLARFWCCSEDEEHRMKRAADEEQQRMTMDELKLTEKVFAVSFLEERPPASSAIQLDGLRQEIQVATRPTHPERPNGHAMRVAIAG